MYYSFYVNKNDVIRTNILIKGSFQRGCDQEGYGNPKKDATKDVQLALTIELAR